MFFYVAVLLIIALFALITKPNFSKLHARVFAVFSFGLLTLISAVRSIDVGVDTLQYCTNYPIIGMIDWANHDTIRYEFGYFAFCKLLNYISSDYRLLIVVSSILIFSCVAYFYYKYSEDLPITVFLVITLLIDAFLMSAMRQALAIALVLLALDQLLNGKQLRFVLLVLLASQFHTSAIACLVFWPLLKMRFSTKSFVLLTIMCIVAFIFARQIYALSADLIGKYDDYLDDPSHAHGGSNYFGALLRASFYFVIMLVAHYCLKDRKESSEGIAVLNHVEGRIVSPDFLLYAGMLAVLFNVLGMQVEVFSRMSNYFNVLIPLLLPCAFNRIPNSKERPLIKGSSLTLCFVYFAMILILRPEWNGVVPYSTFF